MCGVGASFGPALTAGRILRIFRLFRIFKRAKGLRDMVETIFFSLPAVFHVVTVLVLILFIYSVAGMNLFGTLPLDAHSNFRSFPTAMLTLFRVATGCAIHHLSCPI